SDVFGSASAVAFFHQCCRHLRDLHSFPTRRSSDLAPRPAAGDLVPVVRRLPPLVGAPRAQGADVTEALTLHPLGVLIAIVFALRSEEHTSELQSPYDLVCRLLLEKKTYTHRTPLSP